MDKINVSKKATILVVDDTPDNLTLMSNLLKDHYKVKIANSGERALAIAGSNLAPDLILLDIMMSDIDGFEVCRRLKSAPKTANIPIIFVTAKIDIADEKKGLELGAIDYITKPISPPIVMARLKNHLALKAMADFLRDQNDWDTAERLAFTLKGVSGNVSITGLQQFADKLDVAILDRRAQKQADAGSDELTTQPDNLIADLENTLMKEDDKKVGIVDMRNLKAVCEQLSALLIDDDTQASDVLAANVDMLNSAFPNHYQKLAACIRSFEFAAALAELRAATAAMTA